MHLTQLLHKTLEEKLPHIHKKRLTNLTTACEATLGTNYLHLTGLGRSLTNPNKESSNIKKIDRLLGNGLLQAERDSFYQLMISKIIRDNLSPWIHIDWTCINSLTNLYVLRASLSMPGRSIVLYEACYPKQKENNHQTHQAFLDKLKTLLPPSVQPVIVTDAGFRAPWFAHILQLGWNFVGRLRHKNALAKENAWDWHLSSTYFKRATGRPAYLGQYGLTHKGKVPVNLVLYRGTTKKRVKLNRYKKKSYSGRSQRYSKGGKEPWVLVTSLQQAVLNPAVIVTIYRQRMRIEENIRDTKCPRYGLGLKNSLTRCTQRMNILLLIAALATFAAWLAGLFIQFMGKTADFQTQSAKATQALSVVFLGRRALKKKLSLKQDEFKKILEILYLTTLKTQIVNEPYG